MKLQMIAAVTFAAWGLSACSTMDEPTTAKHADMNIGPQCTTYRETMARKSPAEQRAAAEAHIVEMHGSADAAHIDRHLRVMDAKCGANPAAR